MSELLPQKRPRILDLATHRFGRGLDGVQIGQLRRRCALRTRRRDGTNQLTSEDGEAQLFIHHPFPVSIIRRVGGSISSLSSLAESRATEL